MQKLLFKLFKINVINWLPVSKAVDSDDLVKCLVMSESGKIEDAYLWLDDWLFYGDQYGEYEGMPMDPQPLYFARMPKCKN